MTYYGETIGSHKIKTCVYPSQLIDMIFRHLGFVIFRHMMNADQIDDAIQMLEIGINVCEKAGVDCFQLLLTKEVHCSSIVDFALKETFIKPVALF